MEVGPFGAEFFPTDGRMDRRTDVAKLTVDFRNFSNVSKNPVFSAVVVSQATHFLCCGIYICLNIQVQKKCLPENYCSCTNALSMYEGWNFNSGNYLFTTDTK